MALQFETEVIGIGSLLNRCRLTVPEHQRVFAWTTDEVRELWQDIEAAVADEPDGYFLGQVVLGEAEGDGRETIIDGQQRLATTSLLYGAVVALLRERNTEDDRERSVEIDKKFLAEKDLETLEMNRPGFVGGSIPWKRGWSYAEGNITWEADVASVFRCGEGQRGAAGSSAACRVGH